VPGSADDMDYIYSTRTVTCTFTASVTKLGNGQGACRLHWD